MLKPILSALAIGLALAAAQPAAAQVGAARVAALGAPEPALVKVNGLSTGTMSANWLNGWAADMPGTPIVPNPDGAAPLKITGWVQGYDRSGNATVYRRDWTVTSRVRDRWSPTNNPPVAILPNTVALDDYVYQRAGIRGVANLGTLNAPAPVGLFALPDRGLVANSISQEVFFGSRDAREQSQVAAVICSATDTNGLTVFSTPVSAMSISAIGYDTHAVIDYPCTVDITTLATGLIKFNAKGYPWYGDETSVADSSKSTDPARFSTRFYYKDTTLAASPYYAWVCPASGLTGTCTLPGNDSTCNAFTTEASAIGLPCLTIDKALDKVVSAAGKVDGAHVRVGSGTYTLASPAGNRAQAMAEVIVEKDPAVADTSVVIQWGTAVYRPKLAPTVPLTFGTESAIRFSHVKMLRTGVQGLGSTSDAAGYFIWDQVTWDGGSNNANYVIGINDAFFGGTIVNPGGGSSFGAQAAHEHRMLRGVTSAMANNLELFGWLGNTFTGNVATSNLCAKTGVTAGSSSGAVIAFNTFQKLTTQNLQNVSGCDTVGIAVIQNSVEYISATSSNVIGLNNDGKTGNMTGAVYSMNTFAGYYGEGRDNIFYDDGTSERFNILQQCRGNLHVQLNTKGDYFRGANQSDSSGGDRVGNWGYLYGVGCGNELSNYIDASSAGLGSAFAQAYPGLGAKIGTSSGNPSWIANASFTNYQATTWSGSGTTGTAGTGMGTYSLSAGTVAANMNTRPGLPADLAGNARGATTTCVGAYECAP